MPGRLISTALSIELVLSFCYNSLVKIRCLPHPPRGHLKHAAISSWISPSELRDVMARLPQSEHTEVELSCMHLHRTPRSVWSLMRSKDGLQRRLRGSVQDHSISSKASHYRESERLFFQTRSQFDVPDEVQPFQ